MYLHAYQSYIWNEVASKRISSLGLKPCVGDLVMENDKVIQLTADNLNKYGINDVILPLPGHDVLYPSNSSSFFFV